MKYFRWFWIFIGVLFIGICGCTNQYSGEDVSRTGRVPEVKEYESLLERSAWRTEGDVVWIFLDHELYEDYSLIYPYHIQGDQFILGDVFYTFSAFTGARKEYPSESVSLKIVFLDENVLQIGDVTAYRDQTIDVDSLTSEAASSQVLE